MWKYVGNFFITGAIISSQEGPCCSEFDSVSVYSTTTYSKREFRTDFVLKYTVCPFETITS
jgi:hypothetical protein